MEKSKTLVKKYYFYEKYHQNLYNKLVHILCIPMLVWTTTVFFSYISLFTLKLEDHSYNITLAMFVSFLYVSYYLYLDSNLGMISIFLFYFNLVSASNFVNNNTFGYGMGMSLLLHVTSWFFQIMSHKVFEGNKPALLDSITQSFSIAPLFTLLELLFLLGYRKDLDKKLSIYKKIVQKSE